MSPNRQTVEAIYAAFSRRDIAAVMALASSDIRIEQSTALPWGGKFSGHDGLRDFLARLTEQVDSSVEVERFIDAGSSIVAIGRTKGTIRATGRTFDVPVAHVWRIQDGKATAFFPFVENTEILNALQH